MALTPRQKLFVEEYLVDLNATQAAIRAGYSQKTARSIGQENLTKPDIAKAIQEAMDKRAEEVQLTSEDIVRDLMELRDMCMGRKPMAVAVKDEDGNIVQADVKKVDTAGANRALELLGKHKAMFVDRKHVEGTGSIMLVTDGIDED